MNLISENDLLRLLCLTKTGLDEQIGQEKIPTPIGRTKNQRMWNKAAVQYLINEYSFATQGEAAEMLGLDQTHFSTLVRYGILPRPRHLRNGGKERRMYERDEITRLEEHWKEVQSLAKQYYKEVGLADG